MDLSDNWINLPPQNSCANFNLTWQMASLGEVCSNEGHLPIQWPIMIDIGFVVIF